MHTPSTILGRVSEDRLYHYTGSTRVIPKVPQPINEKKHKNILIHYYIKMKKVVQFFSKIFIYIYIYLFIYLYIRTIMYG
jgi:hypothetical protein